MQFRVIVVTIPQTLTQTHTHRQDRLQYTAPQLAHSVIRQHLMQGHIILTIVKADTFDNSCCAFKSSLQLGNRKGI